MLRRPPSQGKVSQAQAAGWVQCHIAAGQATGKCHCGCDSAKGRHWGRARMPTAKGRSVVSLSRPPNQLARVDSAFFERALCSHSEMAKLQSKKLTSGTSCSYFRSVVDCSIVYAAKLCFSLVVHIVTFEAASPQRGSTVDPYC